MLPIQITLTAQNKIPYSKLFTEEYFTNQIKIATISIIYPNPTSGITTVTIDVLHGQKDAFKSGQLLLTNNFGYGLFQQNIDLTDTEHTLNLIQFAKGNYTLSLFIDKQLIDSKQLIIN